MKTYLIPFLLASLFLAQNPAPAAVQQVRGEEYTTEYKADFKKHPKKAKLRSKGAWPNVASWAFSTLSFGPFFLGLGMFAVEGLFYFITGYSLLVASQIVVFLAIGMALSAIIFGLLGRKRPRPEMGRNGIILGLIVIALSALLLIL